MSGVLRFTILGCGSSGGVPRADGDWGDCDPNEPKNWRTRCSLLVRRAGEGSETTAIVDTSPDLRGQTALAGAKRMDAVLLTHDHAGQTHGLDDVRAFFNRQRARIPCYMDPATTASMQRRFGYVFEGEGGYPAICRPEPLPPHGQAWAVDGPSGAIPVSSFVVDHGGIDAVGFRFGGVGYAPDVVNLPPAAMAALAGLEVLVIDALRWTPHPTHAHVEKTLGWIEALKPRRAILTNMHIDLDYRALAAALPPSVEPAYDGLVFDHQIDD